jgi:hypothetical protein
MVVLVASTFGVKWYNTAVPKEEVGGQVAQAGALQVQDRPTLAEIDRILQSGIFKNAEALRRLLRFLADRMLAGEADQLKEYTVGIDGLGKPPTYDPRLDSTVRIQVGRLRQKLAEYYRTEGKQDPLIIDLPKGRFKLTCEPNPLIVADQGQDVELKLGACPRNRGARQVFLAQ